MFHLFTKIDSISTSELEAKLREPIQLLDVRTPMEFRRSHIKNAKNVPLTEIGSYTPATKPVILDPTDGKAPLLSFSGIRWSSHHPILTLDPSYQKAFERSRIACFLDSRNEFPPKSKQLA